MGVNAEVKQGASRVFPLPSTQVVNSLASNLYNKSFVFQINRMSPTGRCLGNPARQSLDLSPSLDTRYIRAHHVFEKDRNAGISKSRA